MRRAALERRIDGFRSWKTDRPSYGSFPRRQEVRCVHIFFSNLFIEKDILLAIVIGALDCLKNEKIAAGAIA